MQIEIQPQLVGKAHTNVAAIILLLRSLGAASFVAKTEFSAEPPTAHKD